VNTDSRVHILKVREVLVWEAEMFWRERVEDRGGSWTLPAKVARGSNA
jgi:hypothetical protein